MELRWGTERRATGDGRTVVWWEAGDGDPVVLVHGFPDGPWAWRDLAGHLVAAGHRVVAPYLRGYHPDTIVRDRPYDVATLGDDVLTVMDATDVEVGAVVGHDWGASAAMAAANLDPSRVRAVVSIGIPHQQAVEPDPSMIWAVRHFVTLKLPFADQLVRARDFAYVEALYRRWAPEWDGPMRTAMLARMRASFADDRVVHEAVNHYRDLDRVPSPVAMATTLVPGMVVAGRHDLGGNAAPYLNSPRAFRAGCEVVMVDAAGHWPHLERPEVVTPALLRMLAV